MSTKPNYAQLLAQIAAETDPVLKQQLIDQAFQFVFDDITDDEIELFSYLRDGYVVPNPGYGAYGNNSEFASYVGVYYNDDGETT